MFTDDAINPCLESTYNFVRHLVKELVTMHNETQPLTTFHFGGDEVARGAWMESPSCKLIAPKLNTSEKTLPSRLMEYFVQVSDCSFFLTVVYTSYPFLPAVG